MDLSIIHEKSRSPFHVFLKLNFCLTISCQGAQGYRGTGGPNASAEGPQPWYSSNFFQ